jgi:predicted Abi (CAAX) family protease
MNMAPTFIIVLLFLTAFMLLVWQYFKIDPRRRILNVRFAMMVAAIATDIGYPIHVSNHPGDRYMSWVFLLLGLFWVALALVLLRTMPPPERY